jgi:MFS family permease
MVELAADAQAVLLLRHPLCLFGNDWLRWVSIVRPQLVDEHMLTNTRSLMNTSQLLPSWVKTMNSPSEAVLGRLSAMYSIGSIASLPIVPFLGDRFGRKTPITIGCVIMVICVQASAHAQPQYEGARFFMGFGNSLAQLSCPLLLTEIAHPQHRARVTAVYNCLWNLGALICGWLAFGTSRIDGNWSWRIPTLIQGIFSVIQLAFIWWIPESPRWLISKDRAPEALNMLYRAVRVC